ncbi:hypothetical protein A2U01_0085165, partial [Trifolium medium]|nr:hypothetical protein [Trifolium medium]
FKDTDNFGNGKPSIKVSSTGVESRLSIEVRELEYCCRFEERIDTDDGITRMARSASKC